MPKNYVKKAEDQSIHLAPSNSNTDIIRKGERTDTSPFRAARMIGIDRIQPDPNQPRKTLNSRKYETTPKIQILKKMIKFSETQKRSETRGTSKTIAKK